MVDRRRGYKARSTGGPPQAADISLPINGTVTEMAFPAVRRGHDPAQSRTLTARTHQQPLLDSQRGDGDETADGRQHGPVEICLAQRIGTPLSNACSATANAVKPMPSSRGQPPRSGSRRQSVTPRLRSPCHRHQGQRRRGRRHRCGGPCGEHAYGGRIRTPALAATIQDGGSGGHLKRPAERTRRDVTSHRVRRLRQPRSPL